jgi:hypothetical protein
MTVISSRPDLEEIAVPPYLQGRFADISIAVIGGYTAAGIEM